MALGQRSQCAAEDARLVEDLDVASCLYQLFLRGQSAVDFFP